MISSNQKRNSKDITKDQLIELYHIKKMRLEDIGKYFGYVDRQPITRLFRKFGINTRTRSESGYLIFENKNNSNIIPEKKVIELDMKTLSIRKMTTKYNLSSEDVLLKIMKTYGLDRMYFVNSKFKELIADQKYNNLTPKEVSDMFGVSISTAKYYKRNFIERSYKTADDIRIKFLEDRYDIQSQGMLKMMIFGDIGMYNSILKLTENHELESNKFTERLYRLFNDYDYDQKDICKYCDIRLKFYTFALGYGYSEKLICKKCLAKHFSFGVSAVSQKLFDTVYGKLIIKDKDICRYNNLNGEMIIMIENTDIIKLKEYASYMNSHRYHLDFVFNNKVIEFDGSYWHRNYELRDKAKDAFLKLKGYEIIHINELEYNREPEKVLEKCITFLTQ